MTDKVEQPEPALSSSDLICQGTKAFWLRDYKEAVNAFGKVSEMLMTEHNDDTYDGLGNVYLYYGKSLLELAREAGDPLGEVVPKEVGVAVEGSEEEGSEDDEDGEDGGEGEEGEEAEEASKDSNKEPEKKKMEEETKTGVSINGECVASNDAANTSTQSSSKDTENPEGDDTATGELGEEEEEDDGEDEDTEGNKEDEEEEPSDLQLAWEVLELAKEIFQKRGDSGKEDYADCLITLGEVSMEGENFDLAIEDIRVGLAIQAEIYTEGKDMRKLAHSHYMLGMALCADNKTEESMACYETTLRLMKDRLDLLQAIKEPGASDEREIAEIKSLIPEVEEKVVDLQNYIEEKLGNPQVEEEQPKLSSPEKKATDISHLVKRKREEDTDAKSSATKKLAR